MVCSSMQQFLPPMAVDERSHRGSLDGYSSIDLLGILYILGGSTIKNRGEDV